MVGLRIQSVVNRDAISGAETQVPINNRQPTTIRKDKVVIGNQTSEWITLVVAHPRQRCRRINIPESYAPPGGVQIQNRSLQELIVGSNSTMLDHQLCAVRLVQHGFQFRRRLIHAHIGIFNFPYIPFLLTPIDVGLGEGDLVPKPMKTSINAPVIRGGTVPVRRSNAGSENKDFHRLSSS